MIRRLSGVLATVAVLVVTMAQIAPAQVTITYFNWFAEPAATEVERQIIELFEAIHPDIRVERLAELGAENVWEKATVMAAGGVAPDIVAVALHVGLGARRSGLLLDLRPYVERDGIDFSQFRPGWELTTGPDSVWGGAIYGLPWGLGILNIFYNKDMFAERGVPEPYKGWTTDEYLDALIRLTRDSNGDGVPEVYGSWPPYPYYNPWPFIFGGNIADPETGRLMMTEPEFVAAIEWMADVRTNYNVTSWSSGEPAFPAGQVAMTYQWDSYIVKLLNDWNPSFNWSVTWAPRGGGAETVSYGQGHVLSIMKDSRHPDAAWEFLKFYYSPEAQRILAENFLYPMTMDGMRAVTESLVFPAPLDGAEILMPYVDVGALRTVPWWVPGVTEGFNAVIPEFDSGVLGGTMTPTEWAERFATAVRAAAQR